MPVSNASENIYTNSIISTTYSTFPTDEYVTSETSDKNTIQPTFDAITHALKYEHSTTSVPLIHSLTKTVAKPTPTAFTHFTPTHTRRTIAYERRTNSYPKMQLTTKIPFKTTTKVSILSKLSTPAITRFTPTYTRRTLVNERRTYSYPKMQTIATKPIRMPLKTTTTTTTKPTRVSLKKTTTKAFVLPKLSTNAFIHTTSAKTTTGVLHASDVSERVKTTAIATYVTPTNMIIKEEEPIINRIGNVNSNRSDFDFNF